GRRSWLGRLGRIQRPEGIDQHPRLHPWQLKLVSLHVPSYRAVQPPSIIWALPVIPPADSEQRNRTSVATSSASRKRFTAAGPSITSETTCSSVMPRVFACGPIWFITSEVRTYVGQTQLAVMPSTAASRAVARVKPR